MHGEEESLSAQRLKDHSWRIAEKGWVPRSENHKQIIKPLLRHNMLFGRVKKKAYL